MDGSGREWPRDELRVGDTDRQAVVDELQRHYVDGRLSSEELGERVAQALKARTFGELAAPLDDLPALAPRIGALAQPRGRFWSDLRSLPRSQPLALALLLIGLVSMLWLVAGPTVTGHGGAFPVWPVLIWGFFFIGRPFRGGRRRF